MQLPLGPHSTKQRIPSFCKSRYLEERTVERRQSTSWTPTNTNGVGDGRGTRRWVERRNEPGGHPQVDGGYKKSTVQEKHLVSIDSSFRCRHDVTTGSPAGKSFLRFREVKGKHFLKSMHIGLDLELKERNTSAHWRVLYCGLMLNLLPASSISQINIK